MKGVKQFILNNKFLHILVLSIYNYGFWYLNKLTNYYFEKKKFKKKLGYKLNLKHPKSFNEKVVFKKIYDRNPLLTRTADKVAVRDYVKEVLGEKEGEKHLIPLLYVTNKPKTIPFEKLPKDFVIKANHGSGWNIIVRNGKYNKKEIIKKCEAWLNTPYGLNKMEWAYKNIPRKIIIEKFLKDKNNQSPKDYKFHMFHGKCKMIQINQGAFSNKDSRTLTLYNSEWNKIENVFWEFKSTKKILKPKNLKEMINISKKLSKEFDYVKVDLYTLNNKIYVGELTNYPTSGNPTINPTSFDFELGKHWKIKRNYWKRRR